jgi:hypothetical protein
MPGPAVRYLTAEFWAYHHPDQHTAAHRVKVYRTAEKARMKNLNRGVLAFGIALCLAPAVALLQDDQCLASIQAAIKIAGEMCASVPVNQLCYGSGTIEIQPRANVRLVFHEPGDTVDAAAVDGLQLSADPENYGIAVIRPRANLPESALTMVTFGDVTIGNGSYNSSDYIALEVTVTAREGANVRFSPSADETLLGQLAFGETMLADGRLEDGSWIRLVQGGWASAELLAGAADLSLLEIIPADPYPPGEGSTAGPMQAIQLQSGVTDAPCADAPDSGLLLQSPGGSEDVSVVVNNTEILLTGTIYLQSEDGSDGKTSVSVLEGWMSFSPAVPRVNSSIGAGTYLEFETIAQDIEFGPLHDYFYTRVRNLPLALLPREIELPFSTGGLITPFEPGTGFLNTLPAEGACTVAWTVDVNLRAGPGTDYPIRQGIGGGYYGQPDARAVGTDGRLWWRLADGIWLAADNTAAAGACGALALVEAPPLPVETDTDV